MARRKMSRSITLFLLALLLLLGAIYLPGTPQWLVDLLAVSVLATLVLIPLEFWRRRGKAPPRRRLIVLDGSNILYWRGTGPQLRTVAQVLRILESQNYMPKIWFDANVGYLTVGRFMGAEELSRRLKLDPAQVSLVPKGQPADPEIITQARDLGVPILSNDRYRDWHEAYPHLAERGALLRGTLDGDTLTLTEVLAPARPA